MSQENLVEIPTAAWAGDPKESLSFPPDWVVNQQLMQGHGLPGLDAAAMAKALEHPLGSPSLIEMTRNCSRACIIVDDLSRPTPAVPALQVLLPMLAKAGLGADRVSLVSALAAHHSLSRADWEAKVGAGVLADYPVYNHNPYENVIPVGRTDLGTELFINREVMACDLKIGIGSLLPYWWPGVYSGGGKLILPGVAGIESIRQHHDLIKQSRSKGNPTLDQVWQNMHQAAEICGLNCLINMVLKQDRQPVGVFAGKAQMVHEQGSRLAQEVYATPLGPRSDVVLVNAYPQDLQIGKSFWGVHASLKPGGSAVIVARHPEGLGHQHFLTSRFGHSYGGSNHNPDFRLKLGEARRIMFYVSRKVKLDEMDMAGADGVEVSFHTKWSEINEALISHHGRQATVTLYPYAALQEPAS